MAGNTRRNIELCFPELDVEARERLVAESLEETGRAMAEMGMSWLWSPARSLGKVRAVHGESLIRDALDEGRGVLLIAPHLGNWEVLNLYVSNRYRPFTAMYKPPQLKLMDDLIRRRRARLGSAMAPANASGVRMVMKALKRGEMVGILPDQEPDRQGDFRPFFGVQALTMKLLPQLARQTGARVICGYAKRLPGGEGFELFFRAAEEGIGDPDLEKAAAAMNRSVEQCVRALPAQYQWEYRRFSRRPRGEPKLYR
ncbi:lysophospholipid acyltransferase family protein [Marinobacterium aestuariivivens]|uniref:Lysophospholipid acyltransferase family protein n=1 Tax=Marinobacterium aestuariivivens TaxID=1698799 RepID=A0ABW1ZZR6_9GAMM